MPIRNLLFLGLLSMLPVLGDKVPKCQFLFTKGDGKFLPRSDNPLAVWVNIPGSPAFKSWRLSRVVGTGSPILEAVVVSDNTGMPFQGARIYLQYGKSKPVLFAISNADGQIKMRVQESMTSVRKIGEGPEVRTSVTKPTRIFVGNPNQSGNVRVYEFSDLTETQNSGGAGEELESSQK
jgi:hypothetical protein